MAKTNNPRKNIVAFLAILMASAATMLWLFWRFPLHTSVVTVLVLAAFGVSARLARSIDTDSLSDLDHGKQRI